MFILKGHVDSGQLIEEIYWCENGNLLIASAHKKYIIMCYFEDAFLGERATESESNGVFQELYGVTLGEKRKFRVFTGNEE